MNFPAVTEKNIEPSLKQIRVVFNHRVLNNSFFLILFKIILGSTSNVISYVLNNSLIIDTLSTIVTK